MSFAARLEQAKQRGADTDTLPTSPATHSPRRRRTRAAAVRRGSRAAIRAHCCGNGRACSIARSTSMQRRSMLFQRRPGWRRRCPDRPGHAQTAFEAGLDATALFDHARGLAPADRACHAGLDRGEDGSGQSEAVAELEAFSRGAAVDRRPSPARPAAFAARARTGHLRTRSTAPSDAPDTSNPCGWRGAISHSARRIMPARRRQSTAPRQPAFRRGARLLSRRWRPGSSADRARRNCFRAAAPPTALAIWRIRHLLRHGRAADALCR